MKYRGVSGTPNTRKSGSRFISWRPVFFLISGLPPPSGLLDFQTLPGPGPLTRIDLTLWTSGLLTRIDPLWTSGLLDYFHLFSGLQVTSSPSSDPCDIWPQWGSRFAWSPSTTPFGNVATKSATHTSIHGRGVGGVQTSRLHGVHLDESTSLDLVQL